MGVASAALAAEAYRLAAAHGLEIAQAARVFEAGSGRSAFSANPDGVAVKYGAMAQDQRGFEQLIAIMRKDIGFASEMAHAMGGDFPGIAGLLSIINAVGDETFETWRWIAGTAGKGADRADPRSGFRRHKSTSLTLSIQSTVLPSRFSGNSEMRHRRCRPGTVPVLLAGREPHHVTWPHFLDRPAPAPDPSRARGDNQGLAEGVRMPVGPRPGLERDIGAGYPCRCSRGEKPVDPHRTGEMIGWRFLRRLRARACDVHGSGTFR